MNTQVRATIDFLKRRIAARAAGYPVSYTTDPSWLINTAINRRAGEVDVPHVFATSPLNHRGRIQRKRDGDWQAHLRLITNEVNTPRLIVHEARLGEHRWLLKRLPGRFTNGTD